jgi:hypothetical protein
MKKMKKQFLFGLIETLLNVNNGLFYANMYSIIIIKI